MKKALFLFIIFLLFDFTPVFSKEPVKLRVAIFYTGRFSGEESKRDIFISVSGPFEIADVKSGKILYSAKSLGKSKIIAEKKGFKIGGLAFNADALAIARKKKTIISLNSHYYRGELSIIKNADNELVIVNTVDIESYLKGVLYHEISHKWPIDVIKAQAVAARTYAMYQKEFMKAKDYDLTADIFSQVYGGYSSEKDKTNKAVDWTVGEVLSYKGKVFPAYFHATCGGITENASELWNVNIEPLTGGRVCSFCMNSPHYYWKAAMDFKAIQEKLGVYYKIKGRLCNIAVSERTLSGRVKSLELKDENEESFIIFSKDFRLLMGPDIIRSTNLSILLEDGAKVIFTGKGWGHGCGLCQWGAFGMSKKGYDYKQILEFYYPGSEIIKSQ